MKHESKKFKTVKVKGGKEYVEVKERIQYLAFDFDGEYSIETDYDYFPDRKMWVVKAKLTLKQGDITSVYTGLAQEVESDNWKDVNSTSALENAESSAVGRACAMAGIGVNESIASADEVNKAVNRGSQFGNNSGSYKGKPAQKKLLPEQAQTIRDLQENPYMTLDAAKLAKLDSVNQSEADKLIQGMQIRIRLREWIDQNLEHEIFPEEKRKEVREDYLTWESDKLQRMHNKMDGMIKEYDKDNH